MQIVSGNLWTFKADWRGITTNGYVKESGECVMGRGCAQEARYRYPNLPMELGYQIKQWGNHPYRFDLYNIFSFPVKHNWWEKADLELIRQSTNWLGQEADSCPSESFVLPRPGCGNGKLNWDQVLPIVEILPDNVFIISKG